MLDIPEVQEPGLATMDTLAKAQLLEGFIASLEVVEASKGTYRRGLKQFFLWLDGTHHQGGLNRTHILAYRNHLISTGKSSLTVSGYMTVIRKFFEYLESQKIYPNIAKDIKGMKKPRGYRKDCLSAAQLRKVLSGFDTDTLEGKRDYAIFNLQARTGIRVIEVTRALVGDIRQEAGQAVLWVQGKGRLEKDDFVLLTEAALDPIQSYLSLRKAKSAEPLFTSTSNRNKSQPMTPRSISRIIKEGMRKAGLDSVRLTAHSLRHTAVSMAIQGGASLAQAQGMARHSDPKTTMVYFHNLQRVKDGAEKYIDF